MRTILSVAAAGLAVLLSACASDPPPAAPAEINVSHLPELKLNVAEFQVIPAYSPPQQRPNVEHLFAQTPQDGVALWGNTRVTPVGRSHRAMLVIRSAPVTEELLRPAGGLSGVFSRDPSERYTGVVEVELEIRNDRGERVGWVTTTAERSETVLEKTSEPERRQIWAKLTQLLVDGVAQGVQDQMRKDLANFIAE